MITFKTPSYSHIDTWVIRIRFIILPSPIWVSLGDRSKFIHTSILWMNFDKLLIFNSLKSIVPLGFDCMSLGYIFFHHCLGLKQFSIRSRMFMICDSKNSKSIPQEGEVLWPVASDSGLHFTCVYNSWWKYLWKIRWPTKESKCNKKKKGRKGRGESQGLFSFMSN